MWNCGRYFRERSWLLSEICCRVGIPLPRIPQLKQGSDWSQTENVEKLKHSDWLLDVTVKQDETLSSCALR